MIQVKINAPPLNRRGPTATGDNGRTARLWVLLEGDGACSCIAGLDAVFVAYKGIAEVVQALLNGSIDFSIDSVSANLPLIKDGKLRALAKLNNRSLPALQDLQSLAVAANMPRLGNFDLGWSCGAGRGRTRNRIQRALGKVAADPEVISKLANFGITAVVTTPCHPLSFAIWYFCLFELEPSP